MDGSKVNTQTLSQTLSQTLTSKQRPPCPVKAAPKRPATIAKRSTTIAKRPSAGVGVDLRHHKTACNKWAAAGEDSSTIRNKNVRTWLSNGPASNGPTPDEVIGWTADWMLHGVSRKRPRCPSRTETP
jgi:hypothetical protein